ncbi:MAG: ABC transporter permease subunit [Planctomycetota bacterium]
MKYKIIKAIDLAGLNFLTPVVRLCYGEDPQKQIREIGQFIVVPIVAVVVAMGVWFVVSDKIQTKSGKLPNPTETYSSASAIWRFHDRENDKMAAYDLTGDEREDALAGVDKRLEELKAVEAEANEKVKLVKAEAQARLDELVAPMQSEYDELSANFKSAQKQREADLKQTASEIAPDDKNAKEAYAGGVREHREKLASERDTLRALKADISTLRGRKDSAVVSALAEQTAIAEERQYLGKMRDQLTSANRSEKVAKETSKLEAAREKLVASEPDKMYSAATSVVRSEDRIKNLEASEYAKPATLPFQIKRSVLCVFCGFFIGSAIAIPLGVLCGLSKTFMAAMTPFIALFKPVSPIVWLPVALIIVGGFIPDPDKHWFTQWLWDLPWLGKYQINPAFIASAFTVALCSLWATMTNTALGVASVDKDHINVARVLRLGFWDRLFKIVLPSALPLVFAGLRISLGVGWMVLIAAELLSSSEGIGKFVWDQFNNGASDSFAKMVVVVFVVGAIGLILDRIMIVLQRLVSFDGAPTAI